MKLNSKLNRVFFIIFVIIWAGLAVVNLLIPEKSFSENENRYLSQMPKFSLSGLLSGDFMNRTDEYVNDQFIFRDMWISVQSTAEYALGKRESNGVYVGPTALMSRLDNWDAKVIEHNLGGIKYFLQEHELPAYLMLVPAASEIYRQELPLFADPWDQERVIKGIYESLPELTPVPVGDTLSAHKNEYIFYRTDHHWTSYGAYLAYRELCSAIGLTPSEYTAKTVSKSFDGTLFSRSGFRFTQSDTIEAFVPKFSAGLEVYDGSETKSYDSPFFEEYLGQKDKYAYFLGPNQPVVTLYGDSGSGKKLLMFKDSFAHCLAPMLLGDYDQVTLVDLRYVKTSIGELLDPDEFDSVLFLFGIDTFVGQDELYKLNNIFE